MCIAGSMRMVDAPDHLIHSELFYVHLLAAMDDHFCTSSRLLGIGVSSSHDLWCVVAITLN